EYACEICDRIASEMAINVPKKTGFVREETADSFVRAPRAPGGKTTRFLQRLAEIGLPVHN
ncbi:MAG TPA: hypothetical protein H9684_05805, partial [Firmicutes bacterium]|nr:hypothetical protein [Bacillota bacterium]